MFVLCSIQLISNSSNTLMKKSNSWEGFFFLQKILVSNFHDFCFVFCIPTQQLVNYIFCNKAISKKRKTIIFETAL